MNNINNLIFLFGAKYLYLVVIAIAFIWFLRQPMLKQKEILILGCICLPLVYIISRVSGHIYYIPRPFVTEHFKPLVAHEANNGFVSDHVLLAAAVSAVIFPFNWSIGSVLWILTLFIGISRVYAGVHHPIDIIGSILIAVMVVIPANFIIRYFKKDESR